MSGAVIEAAPLPFSSDIKKFIDVYVQTNDLEKAAVEARFPAQMGRALWKRKGIREEIERRQKAIEGEIDKVVAKKRIVTVDALDRSLMKVVRLTKADIKEAPSLAAPVVRAIELGYQRTGLMMDGNFIPDSGSDASKPEDAPRIFRATEQSILTHQVTETRQVVTTRQVEGAQPGTMPSEPRTVNANAEGDPWENF